VLFVGLNVPGSNNNFLTILPNGTMVGNLEEYTERNAANLAWMQEAFLLATEGKMKGLMLIIQANPGFELLPEERTGYNEFLSALEEATLAFGKPVVLVHGDSHYFRIDKPLPPSTDPEGLRIVNFTRVETFGQPNIHWLRGTVDPQDPNLFSFRQESVEGTPEDR
jgi:hypothetical protein